MARRSQCSSAGENPLDPNYLPPHYREEYRLAIDALIEADLEGYYGYLSEVNVVDFLCLPEIEYIKSTVREPRQTVKTDTRYVLGDADGSSDTYWPTHSDLDAPELDLGWPQQHRFVGPTEITTLVNPSDPEMPSIKEQARRMIRSAQQVVAVAMDMFTDIDIFADIVDAAMRNVAVYVLLDEINAQHFVAMAHNCRVNLDEIKFMRVRTISGSTYFCHTGKSFKGQMMNRFILVDCRVVLSGNYSFMWSYEKIHRCIAHVFFGELVTTFDEEFRILYAQSDPLDATNANKYADYTNLPGRKHILESTHAFKKEYSPFKDNCQEWLMHSFDKHLNVGPKSMPLRSSEIYHNSTDDLLPHTINAINVQKLIGAQQFLEQRRPMKGPTAKEIGSFKGFGHKEGPSCVYAQKNALSMGKYQNEHMEIPGHHFVREEYFHQMPSRQIYAKPRNQGYHQYDQYSEFDFPSEKSDAEESKDYDHVQRYLQSYPTMEEEPDDNVLVPVKSASRRPSMGKGFACQSSASKLNPQDQKHVSNINNENPEPKEGLRVWRISSYLSALQNTGQSDIEDLQSSESCDDVPYGRQGTPEPDISTARQDSNWFTKRLTSKNRLPAQQISSLTFPEITVDLTEPTIIPTNAEPTPPSASGSSYTTDGDNKEPNSFYEEFFKKKGNLALQKNSKLRHSLIFNSNQDQDILVDNGNSLVQKDEGNLSKQSLAVSSLFEKKRPVTKKLIQWTDFLRSSGDTASVFTPCEDFSSKQGETEEKKDESFQSQKVPREEMCITSQKTKTQYYLAEDLQKTQPSFFLSGQALPFVDMNDPECRLQFFKELAAKRKAEQKKETKDTFSQEHDELEAAPKSDTVKLPALKSFKKTSAATDDMSSSPQTQLVNTLEKFKDTIAKPAMHLKPKLSTYNSAALETALNDVRVMTTTATDAEKLKHKKKLSEDCDIFLDIAQEKTATTKPDDLITQTKHTNLYSKTAKIGSPEFMFTGNTLLGELGPSSICLKKTRLDSVDSQVITALNSNVNITTQKKSASQQFTLIETGKAKQHASTNAPTSIQNTASQTGHCKHSNVSEFGHADHSGITDVISSISVLQTDHYLTCPPQPYMAKETCSLKPFSSTETVPFQQTTAKKTNSIYSTAAITGPVGIGPPQLVPSAIRDTSQHPIETCTKTIEHHTVMETGSSSHLFTTETCTLQQPIPEIYSLSHSTYFHAGLSPNFSVTKIYTDQHPPETYNSTFLYPTITEKCSDQTVSAIESDSFQDVSAVKTVISQCPSETDMGCLEDYSETKTKESQHPSDAKAGLIQQHTATDCLQIPSVTDTSPVEHVCTAVTDITQHSSITNTDMAADPYNYPSKVGPSHQPTDKYYSPNSTGDTRQCPLETENSILNRPTVSEKCSDQNVSAMESDSSQDVSAVKTGSSQCPPETDTGYLEDYSETKTKESQHPSDAKAGLYQQHTATDCLQVSSATDTRPLKHVCTAKTDSTIHSPITNTDMEALPSNYPFETKVGHSQQTTDKYYSPNSPGDTPQCSPEIENSILNTPIVTEKCSDQNISAMESDSSQDVSAVKTGSSQCPPETDTGYLEDYSETKTKESQHPSDAKAGLNQQHTATDCLQVSSATDTRPLKHVCTAKTDSTLHSPIANTDMGAPHSNYPSETKVGHSQQPTDTDKYYSPNSPGDTPQCSPEIENNILNTPIVIEKCSNQNVSAMKSDSSQDVSAVKSGSSQCPPETDTGYLEDYSETKTTESQHLSDANAGLIQQHTATDCLHISSATDIRPLKHVCIAKTDTTQHSPIANTDMGAPHSNYPSETKAGPSQKPTDTDKYFFPNSTGYTPQCPPESENSILNTPTVTEKCSDQNVSAIEFDSSQDVSALKTDSSHCLSETDTEQSKHSIVTEIGFFQHPPFATGLVQQFKAIDTNYLHIPTALQTDLSQYVSAAKTGSSLDSLKTKMDTLDHHSVQETGPIQQSFSDTPQTNIDSVLLKHSTVVETGLSHCFTVTERDPLQNSTVKKEKETSLSKYFSALKSDTSHCSTETAQKTGTSLETGLSQQPDTMEINGAYFQCSSAQDTGPVGLASITKSDSSQNSLNTDFNTSIVTKTGPSEDHSLTKSVPTQKNGTCFLQNCSTTNLSQNVPHTATDSLQIQTSKESLSQHVSHLKTNTAQSTFEKKAVPLQQLTVTDHHFIKTRTRAETNSAQQTDCFQDPHETETCILEHSETRVFDVKTEISQHFLEVTTKHSTIMETSPSKSSTATESDSMQKSNETKTCFCNHLSTKDTDFMQLSATRTPEPNITSVKIGTTSLSPQPTAMETDISQHSNAQDSSAGSSNQLESELKKDMIKNGKPRKDESQQQVELIDSVKPWAVCCNEDNEAIKIQEHTEQVESSKCNHAESKAENCQTLSFDSLNLSAEISVHPQPSSANSLSCSNLRDDTKILLEQISAKNQEKVAKLTLSVDEATDNLKLDKQITVRHWTQTWSAKASPEEREELLQKMEKKRKEKIYSRFEVP